METTDLTTSILRSIRDDIARLETRFDARFDKIEIRLDNHDKRFDKVDAKLVEHDAKFLEYDDRFDKVEHGFEKLEVTSDRYERWFYRLDATNNKHARRFDKLDAKVDKLGIELGMVRDDLMKRVGRDELMEALRLADERHERLHRQVVEQGMRLTAQYEELHATMNQMMTYFGAQGSLEVRVDRCERDIVDLKERVF